MRTYLLSLAILLSATVVLAHKNVQNAAVLEWMDSMVVLADQLKIIGDMAKGSTEFNAEVARSAAAQLSQEALRIDALFGTPQFDHASEALPAIWEDYETFTTIAQDLVQVSAGAANDIQDMEDLLVSLREIGSTCQECHEDFRAP